MVDVSEQVQDAGSRSTSSGWSFSRRSWKRVYTLSRYWPLSTLSSSSRSHHVLIGMYAPTSGVPLNTIPL